MSERAQRIRTIGTGLSDTVLTGLRSGREWLATIERDGSAWLHDYDEGDAGMDQLFNRTTKEDRADRLKALGNSIVPQVAERIFAAINEVMRIERDE